MRRRQPPWRTAAAFWTCSGTEEFQLQTGLLARAGGQALEKFTLAFGVQPLFAVKPEVKAAGAGRHPKLLQGFLQIDDDLATVGERQGDHSANALVVDVGIGAVVDAVAGPLQCAQGGFCVVQVFVVGHYNAIMINKQRILGAAQGMSRPLLIAAMFTTGLLVSACGQKGPLYLPPPEAKAAITAPVPGDTAGPVEKTTK